MARVIEVTGKDIEEAKKLALSQLDLPQERVIFEVLEEPSKGFFGLIGARVAKIRATEKELTPLEKGQEFLKKIFKSMHKDIQIECIEEDINYKFNLIGDDLGVLIGKHGQTLDSLQYLTNMAANKNVTGARVRIVLDVENNSAELFRNENESIVLDGVPDNIFDSLADADKLLVCELSNTENEEDSKIVYAYEADIED